MSSFRTSLQQYLAPSLLSLGLLSAGSALAAGPDPFSRMNPPRSEGIALLSAPIDAQQLWGRLYEMLRTTDVPAKSQFEAALGAPMRESLTEGDTTFYALNAGKARFFDVSLSHYDSHAHVRSRSRMARVLDERGGCVSPAQFTSELMAIGWVPGQYDQQEGTFYSFSHRGARDQMFLFLTQGCVNRVSIAIGS